MITITRSVARQIATLFRKALALSNHQFANQFVQLQAGPHGLTIQAATAQCAVAYHETTPIPSCVLQAPLEMFKTVSGTKSDLVTLVETEDGKVIARWQDGAVPRQGQWNCRGERPVADMPELPASFTDNPPEFVAAIREAIATMDANPTRFALNCLRLRGVDGSVAATDGRQVFKHSGFDFGFSDEVLFYPANVMDAKDLPTDKPLSLGRTETHLVFTRGPWTFYQQIEKERRFPRVEDVIPQVSGNGSTLEWQANDAAFLVVSLRRLPGTEDTNQPVTIDLNGKVAIRAQANSDAQPTEIVLQNSRRGGAEIRLATDRRYLVRAAQLGFDRIYFPSDVVPAVCDDGRRTYVWALLSKEGIIAPTATATVIESPTSPGTAVAKPRPVVPITNHIPIEEPVNSMKTNASPAVARKTTQPQSTAPAPSGSSIEQAIALRNQLRGMLTNTNVLISSLKRQKQQQRLMSAKVRIPLRSWFARRNRVRKPCVRCGGTPGGGASLSGVAGWHSAAFAGRVNGSLSQRVAGT